MRGFKVLLLVLTVCGAMRGQEISLDGSRPAAKQHLVLLSDAVQVEAGKPQTVELRFRVDPGFHINSHAPKDETLIPTILKLDATEGVQVQDASYPAGSAFRLAIGEGQTLDVYQGEFRVVVKMLVRKGDWSLTGGLRYQACDSAACFPPRTLPVRVAVVGR
jgi:DsbC/DsbD-like thiol-disulfide interchange protein